MNVDKTRRTPDARDVFDDDGINAVLSQSLKPIGHRRLRCVTTHARTRAPASSQVHVSRSEMARPQTTTSTPSTATSTPPTATSTPPTATSTPPTPHSSRALVHCAVCGDHRRRRRMRVFKKNARGTILKSLADHDTDTFCARQRHPVVLFWTCKLMGIIMSMELTPVLQECQNEQSRYPWN